MNEPLKKASEGAPKGVAIAGLADHIAEMPDYVLHLLDVLPIPSADASIQEEARKAFNPIVQYVLKAAEDGHERQKVLGYQRGSLTEILDITQSRNSAAEQIVQDIKAINAKSLTAASDSLEKADKIYTETLLKLFDDGNVIMDNAECKFHSLLRKHREEFGKAFDCNMLLEYGTEARYMQIKTAIDSVMKRSFLRSNNRFDELVALDKQNFQWTVKELQATKIKWESGEAKRKQSHDAVNEKLAKLSERTLDLAGKV
jgi:hypothetical protein